MVKLTLGLALGLGVLAAEAKVQWLPHRPPAALRNAALAEEAFSSALTTPFQLSSVPRFPPAVYDTPQPSPAPGSRSLARGRRAGGHDALAAASQSHGLGARAVPPEYERMLGPAFKMSNCIFCRDDKGVIDDEGDAEAILRFMTSEMFLSYVKGGVSRLKNRCVFYTKGLNGLSGLSDYATTFACQQRSPLYTIWHLFPNSYDAGRNAGVRDFYCLWDDGDHWLAPVRDAAIRFAEQKRAGASPAIRYFQQMSEAMAKMCSGRVIVMTQTPTTLADYRPGRPHEPDTGRNNIFWSHERPVIADKIRRGEAELYAVDYADQDYAYPVKDERTLEVGDKQLLTDLGWSRQALKEMGLLQVGRELEARADMCATSGLGSQRAGDDYFG